MHKFNFTMESLQTRFHIIDCHEVLRLLAMTESKQHYRLLCLSQ
ncbi:hypothetical protein [Helicobacter rodentium]|nr:hypothetical protein [Helicobacter rodentium]